MTLPMWTRQDVANLARRVRRVQPKPVPLPLSCDDCNRTPAHEHASHWVGPYLICRCLRCPVLVVRVA